MEQQATQKAIEKPNNSNLDKILVNKDFDELLNLPRYSPDAPTRIIVVSLSKGGVGKTTTAANIAHGLALEKRKVLLVDTDRQGQCRLILGNNPVFGTAEFSNPYEQDRFNFEDVVHLDAERPFLHFLRGSKSIDGWETNAMKVADEDMLNPMRRFEFIKEAFSKIQNNYDYIIFDTPPKIGIITLNVLFYATELLIPAKLSAMSEDALKEFVEDYAKISKTRARMNDKPLKFRYFLPTFENDTLSARSSFQAFQETTQSIQENGRESENLRYLKLLQPIPNTTRLDELAKFGKTIFEKSPTSAGAQSYGIVVEEIIKDEQE